MFLAQQANAFYLFSDQFSLVHLLGDCAKTCICIYELFKSPVSESSQASETETLKPV